MKQLREDVQLRDDQIAQNKEQLAKNAKSIEKYQQSIQETNDKYNK